MQMKCDLRRRLPIRAFRFRLGRRPIALHRDISFFFFDEHLNLTDLAQVQSAATRMLGEALGDSDVVSFTRTNTGMTYDRAKLQQAIDKNCT